MNALREVQLRVLLASGPIEMAKGFADVSRMDNPTASVNSAARNMK